MRSNWFPWVCLVAAIGCGDATSDPMPPDPTRDDGSVRSDGDAGPRDDASRPDADGSLPDAHPIPHGELPIEVGVLGDDGFHAYADGQDAFLTWGPQGGIMITPTIRLSQSAGWAPGEYSVRLTHTADPAHADAFRVDEAVRDTTFSSATCAPGSFTCVQSQTEGDYIQFVRLFNQLHTVSIHDSYTVLDVLVEGQGLRGTLQVKLHLIDPEVNSSCDSFAIEPMPPCRFRGFPGVGRVTAIRPWTDMFTGEEKRELEYTLALDDFTAAHACMSSLVDNETRTYVVDTACTGPGQIQVGTELPVMHRVGLDSCASSTHDRVEIYEVCQL